MSSVITMGTKECTKCRETKPLDFFSKDKASKDGLCCKCKQCASEHNRKHYLANKEAKNAKTRKKQQGVEAEREAKVLQVDW